MAVKMQKTDFEFVNPLKSNLYVRGLKIDEISWQNLTFSKMSKFSAKRHESLQGLQIYNIKQSRQNAVSGNVWRA